MKLTIHTIDRHVLPSLIPKDHFKVGEEVTTPEGFKVTLIGVNRNVQVPLGGFPEVLEFVIQFGSGVAAGVIANWIYAKLKDKKIDRIIIERTEIHLDEGQIQKVIEETIRLNDK